MSVNRGEKCVYVHKNIPKDIERLIDNFMFYNMVQWKLEIMKILNNFKRIINTEKICKCQKFPELMKYSDMHL